jgi:hypothetical protein
MTPPDDEEILDNPTAWVARHIRDYVESGANGATCTRAGPPSCSRPEDAGRAASAARP